MADILVQKDASTLVPKLGLTAPQREAWAVDFTIYDVNADGTKGAAYGPTRAVTQRAGNVNVDKYGAPKLGPTGDALPSLVSGVGNSNYVVYFPFRQLSGVPLDYSGKGRNGILKAGLSADTAGTTGAYRNGGWFTTLGDGTGTNHNGLAALQNADVAVNWDTQVLHLAFRMAMATPLSEFFLFGTGGTNNNGFRVSVTNSGQLRVRVDTPGGTSYDSSFNIAGKLTTDYTSQAITFTGALTAAVSGTLTAPWTGETFTYAVTFSDASVRSASFTNGSATVTWSGAVTATANANVASVTPALTERAVGIVIDGPNKTISVYFDGGFAYQATAITIGASSGSPSTLAFGSFFYQASAQASYKAQQRDFHMLKYSSMPLNVGELMLRMATNSAVLTQADVRF